MSRSLLQPMVFMLSYMLSFISLFQQVNDSINFQLFGIKQLESSGDSIHFVFRIVVWHLCDYAQPLCGFILCDE